MSLNKTLTCAKCAKFNNQTDGVLIIPMPFFRIQGTIHSAEGEIQQLQHFRANFNETNESELLPRNLYFELNFQFSARK